MGLYLRVPLPGRYIFTGRNRCPPLPREKKHLPVFIHGIVTHYLLDLLLIQVGYGMVLLYPLSWTGFTLNLVPNDDYYITIVALFIALIVYLVSRLMEKKV